MKTRCVFELALNSFGRSSSIRLTTIECRNVARRASRKQSPALREAAHHPMRAPTAEPAARMRGTQCQDDYPLVGGLRDAGRFRTGHDCQPHRKPAHNREGSYRTGSRGKSPRVFPSASSLLRPDLRSCRRVCVPIRKRTAPRAASNGRQTRCGSLGLRRLRRGETVPALLPHRLASLLWLFSE